MSDILELRQRVEAAEGKFGISAAEQAKYSERLISLVNAVESAAKDARQDQEKTKMSLLAAQAENEQLRGMLHTLLLAMEKDGDAIGPVLRDLEQAVSAISAAGVAELAEPGESGEVLADAAAEPAPEQAIPSEGPAAETDDMAAPESETVFSNEEELEAAGMDEFAPEGEAAPALEETGELSVDDAVADETLTEHAPAPEDDLVEDAPAPDDGPAEAPLPNDPIAEDPLDEGPMPALEAAEADIDELEMAEEEPVDDGAETDLAAEVEGLADDAVAELLMDADEPEAPETGDEAEILADLDEDDLAVEALVEEDTADIEPAEEDLLEEDLTDEELLEDPPLAADAEAGSPELDALDSEEIETLLVDEIDEPDDGSVDLDFEASIEDETPPDLIAPVEEEDVDLLADEAIEEALLDGADDEEEVSMQALAEQIRQKNEAMANGAENANQGG